MQEQQHPKKRNKHQQKPQYKNLNPFKQLEKHFKFYQNQETDFSILYQPEKYQNHLGYQFAFLPYPQGAILVRNFNNPNIAFDITLNALNAYCNKPYRTNLDSRQELYKQEKEEVSEPKEAAPQILKQEIEKQPIVQQKKVKYEGEQQGKIVNEEGVKQELQNKDVKEESVKQEVIIKQEWAGPQEQKGYFFNEKIRWANVGYQYDWTQRKYPNVKTSIPQQISKLCQRANKLYNTIKGEKKNYYPESAIINYYGQKDYMTGHLDDAQLDKASPIYSFSFGLSCIFLIGGNTKQTKPVAVRLNSGDLLIMGGQSRQCYHGVPRILAKTYFPPQNVKAHFLKGWRNSPINAENYLLTHRININVRQVYPTDN